MDLIIDARMVEEKLHGIGRYTYELIKGLSKKDDVTIKILTNDIMTSKKIFLECINIEYLNMKSKFLSPFEIFELPKVINKYKKDNIFISPSFSSSPFIQCKSYMTIHDLNHLKLPQYYSKLNKYYYKFAVKPFANKCINIFTVSNFSKNEIIEWLCCDQEKIIVTYNGIDRCFNKVKERNKLTEIKDKYKLSDKFILYIGNLKPHKNVKTIIKAMKEVNSKYKLVINGSENKELGELIEKENLEDRVQFIGYIQDYELPILYSIARAFVFPSLYEGFGLPVIEAMACGCPTVVSNSSSLPEVAGDASLLVKAEDYKTLAKQVNLILQDDTIRQELIRNGYRNITRFSWEKMIDMTYNAIKAAEVE